MKDQERSDKIKKFLIAILIIISSFNVVQADEVVKEYPDITNDIEIRYKWYKEIVSEEGEYIPLKDVNAEDKIDKNKIKYIGQNIYDRTYCSLPSEYYLITEKISREYKRTYASSYVLIENVDSSTDIQIYSKNKPIKYKIISSNSNEIKINLLNGYITESLLFYVNTDEKYRITIYHDLNLERPIVSKEIENNKISNADKTWTTYSTTFYTYISYIPLEESDLTTLISETQICSFKEKYVYKYNTTKEYYDDNYYLNVDGYIKDEKDYRYFYKGEPITITNTVEIIKEKIVKEPKIEYVYIEKDANNIEENDPSKEIECLPEIKTEIKTKIIEKEIMTIPKKIYIIIIVLFIVILLLSIKLYKKYVE